MTNAWRRFGLPAAVYLAIFFLLNPHLLSAFSSHYFFGGADGYQNVWNLWWVDRAIREFGVQPWFTTLLHHPQGTTLIGHTLNPFNGLLAIALLPLLSMVQTYNTIVVFSFVMTGVTAFWLCAAMTRAYGPSLAGGAIFTFSSYHFMHADAHLQLTALQWLPLFVLWWIRFCEQPAPGRGVAAALMLWLVALCDLYYFAYAVFTAALFYGWMAWRLGKWRFLLRRETWPSLLAFLIPSAATSGVLALAIVYQQSSDPMIGTHSPRLLSMDLLSPVVPGFYWRFRDAVRPLWVPLSPYFTETSVFVGLSVIALGIAGWRSRAGRLITHRGFWGLVVLFFGIMSLGPNLHIAGREVAFGPGISLMGYDRINLLVLPYAVLWLLFPPWRLAGVPVRMMVMVQLAAAVLAAGGWQALLSSGWRWRHAAAAMTLAIVTFEYLPAPMRLTEPAVPAYVRALATLPAGAAIDLASDAPLALYYQTIHHKPIAFGYISRTPASVDRADQALAALILNGEWERAARDFRFTYVVKAERAADVMVPGLPGAPLAAIEPSRRVYHDERVSIYRY